jgi:hypothetical protein
MVSAQQPQSVSVNCDRGSLMRHRARGGVIRAAKHDESSCNITAYEYSIYHSQFTRAIDASPLDA